MSGQRARSAVAADHRSAHPNVAGIPWWGAVLTAVFAAAIGFAFDAGSGGGHLTAVFASLYVIGCLVAVLAVQQSGLFTAVIQPPLVLFVTVPGAYFLMHSSEIQGLKDILINCGYPLIERFPLMFFTSAAVLLIGLARWYFGKAARTAPAKEPERAPKDAGPGLSAKLSAFSGLLGGKTDESDEDPKERRAADRRRARQSKPTAAKARGERPAKRTPPRSRHPRAAETEIIEPVIDDRPRRRRERLSEPPPSEPRRRPRPPSSREPRERESREREPREREPRERRARYERDDRYERARRERPVRRSRYDEYDSYDPYGSSTSHHPVSRVRYRGEDSEERGEYRPRRRASRDAEADRWEYDI